VELTSKQDQLHAKLKSLKKVAVACSGGIDSSFLLKTSCDVLGKEKVLAVTAVTTLQPAEELEKLREIVGQIGCRLLTVKLNPYSWPEFVANPTDRCYLCKKKIYLRFLEETSELAFRKLADGTNRDDLDDYRPGLKALHELKIKTPLADAGLTKLEIRLLARAAGLPNWDLPSSSCLATRIPAGIEITRKLIERVYRCESFLHSFGFFGCRVRLAGEDAVLELMEGDLERLVSTSSHKKAVSDFFAKQGFHKILLNIEERPGVYV